MRKKPLIILSSVLLFVAAILAVFLVFIQLRGKPTLEDGVIDKISNYIKNPEYNNPDTVTVTFPEGYTVVEIAEKLEENGVCTAKDFLDKINNPSDETLNSLGITNKAERIFVLEGYIFPDTYEFYSGENVDSVIGRFIDNFNSKITEDDKKRAAELGYTMDEIITIASVIQEEAGSDAQNGKVSSVLHNRLNTNTPLQCDVTYHYIHETCIDYLEYGVTTIIENNYDTYKCPALPKGPITNPGYASIQAALYPEDTDYLYFVTDPDWNYYYAVTWDEHVANCRIAGIPGY